MPRKYEGEPELSKREKAAKAEKPWHPRQLKGPFLPLAPVPAAPPPKPKLGWRDRMDIERERIGRGEDAAELLRQERLERLKPKKRRTFKYTPMT